MSGDNVYFQTKRVSLSKDKYEKAQQLFEKVKKFIKKNYFEDGVLPWVRADNTYEPIYSLINTAIYYDILGCDKQGLYDKSGYFSEVDFDPASAESFITAILYSALLTAVERDSIEMFIDFFALFPEKTEVEIDEEDWYISICGWSCIELCFGEEECF